MPKFLKLGSLYLNVENLLYIEEKPDNVVAHSMFGGAEKYTGDNAKALLEFAEANVMKDDECQTAKTPGTEGGASPEKSKKK